METIFRRFSEDIIPDLSKLSELQAMLRFLANWIH